MRYRYLYIHRPPGYGHQPDGFTKWEPASPDYKMAPMKNFAGEVDYYFGWVEYDDPLPLEKVWAFNLIPDDPVQWAHYQFYMEADRDLMMAQQNEAEYKAIYPSLDKTKEKDFITRAAGILLEKEHQP